MAQFSALSLGRQLRPFPLTLGRLERGEGVQQLARCVFVEQELAVRRADKALGHSMSDQRQQWCEVARDIEESYGSLVNTNLRPRGDLEEFIEGAIATRERDKAIGEVRHERFSLVHTPNFVQLAQVGVRDLAHQQTFREDADDLSASCQHFVGYYAHQPDARPPIDDAQSTLDQFLSQQAHGLLILRSHTRIRSGENTDTPHTFPLSTSTLVLL